MELDGENINIWRKIYPGLVVATTESTRAAWDKTRHFCEKPVTNLLNL